MRTVQLADFEVWADESSRADHGWSVLNECLLQGTQVSGEAYTHPVSLGGRLIYRNKGAELTRHRKCSPQGSLDRHPLPGLSVLPNCPLSLLSGSPASLPFAPFLPSDTCLDHLLCALAPSTIPSVLQELRHPGVQPSIPRSLLDITTWLSVPGNMQTQGVGQRRGDRPS